MGKKKSKKKAGNLTQEPTKGNAQVGTNGLGINAQQIGTTLVGVLISEIVEAATAQLIQKVTQPNSNGHYGLGDHQNTTGGKPNPLENAKLNLEDQLKDVGPTVTDSVNFARSAMGAATPNMNDVVAVLKDVGQRLKEKSIDALDNSSGNVLAVLAHSAASAMNGLAPEVPTTDSPKAKNSKKGKRKKKHKK
ncbi:MAG TPA: hypothetical protein V6D07_17400 [Trichocoleus sp.]